MGEERNEQLEEKVLDSQEIDTIGEILNISMGSAATAISKLLDKQVNISTPTVEMCQFRAMDYADLEPAILVKIDYVEGISGANVMIFRQKDMQVILNLLMGNDEPPSDDFVFDELSMSAACEVMNQMMGASATALSEFLGQPINISTPEANIVGLENSFNEIIGTEEGEEILAVSFRLSIQDVMDTTFASMLTYDLAKEIVTLAMGNHEDDIASLQVAEAPAVAPAPQPAAPTPAPMPQQVPPQMPAQPAAPTAPAAAAPMPAPAMPPMPEQQMVPPAYAQQAPGAQPQMPQQYPAGYYPPYNGYPGYPPAYPQMPYYGMPGPGAAAPGGAPDQQPAVHVQKTQFPQFTPASAPFPNVNGNMDLLMGVSLDVSVEIGKAKRKIKEILELGQGTVIELNKQAGAPVDIVVNGRLLARGDVVVIDDNFGVRITEILGTKELMESLGEEVL